MKNVDESLRRTQAYLDRELPLGRGARSGASVYVRPEDYLETHTHLIGSSNFGKSYYLEHLLRSYTELGIPAGLFDPHGDLAAAYHRFLAASPRLRRRHGVIHLRPGDPFSAVGFNPFSCGLTEPGEIASLVLEAFFRVWGAATGNETPRLERVLRLMFHAFAENARPLTETYEFLRVENRAYRTRLLEGVRDEKVRQSWQEIELLPKSDKLDRLESSWNRLQRFLAFPAVERLFAPQERTVNFADLYRERRILVADLSLLPSTEAQSLVGTMLVNAMYHAAKRLPPRRRRHCVFAVDEFPQFVTTDIARSLDELRKFGVRLILAHQHLGQLPPELLGSVLTNAKFRIVFGGLSRPDAEIIAQELYTGVVTGDRVKYVNRQTKFRPYLVEREVENFSETETSGESESDGWSRRSSHGGGDADGRSERMGSDGPEETRNHSTHFEYQDGSDVSSGRARSLGKTIGSGRSTQFVTEHEEFCEETSRQFRPLDEEWEKLVARVMNLDRRETLVKLFNGPVLDITTPDIEHRLVLRRKGRRRGTPPPEIPPPPAGRENLPEDFRE